MSGLFKTPTIKGTRISDFSGSNVSVGDPIPFGYGAFPTEGKCIWANLPPREIRKVERQGGKGGGGGGVKQETFTYWIDYAVAFCLGPIDGFLWIKRNGKTVYTNDPNAPLDDIAYSHKWKQRVVFHYGTMDQLPDSLIESVKGTGNVSAFRGLAYFTVENEDVTEVGGAVPSYEAVVVVAGVAHLTSVPMQIVTQESLLSSDGIELISSKFMPETSQTDALMSSHVNVTTLNVTGGETFYTQYPETETISATSVLVTDISVTGDETFYTQYPETDTVSSDSVQLVSLDISGSEVSYSTSELDGVVSNNIQLNSLTVT